MTRNELQLVVSLVVLVPLLGSLLLPLIGKRTEAVRNVFALLFVATSLVGSLLMLPSVLANQTVTASVGGLAVFHVDKLAVFMAMVSSLVGSIIVLYSWSYISHYEHRNEYFFMVVLFLGAMMGLVFSRHLIVLYVFWEITALASWRLIGFFREKAIVLRADKAFLVTFFGALLMLLGFIIVGEQAGTFDMGELRARLGGRPIPNLAAAFILVGILAKSATLPLHTWLPDAGVAPSPVTALLHAAVLVKIGVYVFARLFVATFEVEAIWQTIVPAIAAVSALVSAGAALIDTDLKRIIAFSTVSQIGFIFLGLAVGGEVGVAGGLLYILMHGLAKGGLFLCAGIVEQKTHTKDITKMGGLFKAMPWTAVSFALCAFSVMGIPPFGGFFGKYLVITGALEAGQLTIALTFLFGAFLTILYLLRVFTTVFLGAPKPEFLPEKVREGSRVMVGSVAALAALSLAAGLLISYPSRLVRSTVEEMTTSAAPATATISVRAGR